MLSIHIFEIKIIKIIQLIKSDWVTQFFLMINVFDNNYAYLVVAIIIWNTFEARKGLEFLYLQVIGATLCSALKLSFALPRPYEFESSLKILEAPGATYGFPSGAATAATICFGYIFLILNSQEKLAKFVSVFMILLVGFTRVYLGAHFLSDVIGGYALGAFILTIYFYRGKYIGILLSKRSKVVQLTTHFLLLGVLFSLSYFMHLAPIYIILLVALFVFYFKDWCTFKLGKLLK